MTTPIEVYTGASRVAYFSMVIALADDITTYAGGLGVLAGETMRSAADLDVPMVAVVSRGGYFRQTLNAEGRQTEQPDVWEPAHAARSSMPRSPWCSIGVMITPPDTTCANLKIT